jgi:hypothetical protein
MDYVPITISRETAKELYQAYLKHRHYSTPIDKEVMSAYQKLASGKMVIKALESVASAGVDDFGMPKLAIARADTKFCHLTMSGGGGAVMYGTQKGGRVYPRSTSLRFEWPAGTFSGKAGWKNAESIVPQAPLNLRPKRGMQNYHILFEAEWRKAVPIDPFLLRRIGKADLWLVLAHWDLTSVEAAALSARL